MISFDSRDRLSRHWLLHLELFSGRPFVGFLLWKELTSTGRIFTVWRVSFPLEVEFEFTTWAWVKALPEHRWEVASYPVPWFIKTVNSIYSEFFLYTHLHSFTYVNKQKKLGWPLPERWCVVAWTQAQVVNSNSTSAVQNPSSGGELKLYLGSTGSTCRRWTQTLPRLYRIHCLTVYLAHASFSEMTFTEFTEFNESWQNTKLEWLLGISRV